MGADLHLWFSSACIARKEHRPLEAARAWQEVIKIDPTYPSAYRALGDALMEAGKHDEAADAFKKALEINKDDPKPRQGLKLVSRILESKRESGKNPMIQ